MCSGMFTGTLTLVKATLAPSAVLTAVKGKRVASEVFGSSQLGRSTDVAPWQPLPAPAVHPKQWLPTAMRPPAEEIADGMPVETHLTA